MKEKGPSLVVICLTAIMALGVKLWLAARTYGTNDVYAFERFRLWGSYLGAGLYRADPAFNHPPSMIHILAFLGYFARISGIFFPFWLRLPSILADAGSLWVVSRILAKRLHEPAIRWTLLMTAASPVLILVSGFHGNFDSVVILFLILSIYLTDAGESDIGAGCAFGLSLCIKIVGVVMLPAMILYRRSLSRSLRFSASAGLTIGLAWMPFLAAAPKSIFSQVLGYRSHYGHWGLSWLAAHQPYSFPYSGFEKTGAYLILFVIAALSIWMNRSNERPPLYVQAGLVFFVFLAGANGFGVQYLAWLVPFTPVAGILPVAFFELAAGGFLFLVYNYWCWGMPWYLADAIQMGDWQGNYDYFQIACWISVIWLAWDAIKFRGEDTGKRHPFARFMVPAACVLLLVPLWVQIRRDESFGPAFGADELRSIQAAQRHDLARILADEGRGADAQRVLEPASR